MKNYFTSPDLIKTPFLIIDGLTRSGKTLIAPIVSSLTKTYQFQFLNNIDRIVTLLFHKKISIEAASSLIKIDINEGLYNLNISRNINLRPDDASSILQNINSKQYIKNLSKKEGDYVISEINKKRFLMPYVTHDTLSMLSNFNDLNIPYKLIHIYRDPIENIFKMFKRYKDRYSKKKSNKYDLNNPRFYAVLIKKKNILFPHYSKNKENYYSKLNLLERLVFYYIENFNRIIAQYKKADNKKNILLLKFDDLLISPNNEVLKICKFLSRKKTSFTKKILKSSRLPRKIDESQYLFNVAYLKKNINNDLFNKVTKLSYKYKKNKIF